MVRDYVASHRRPATAGVHALQEPDSTAAAYGAALASADTAHYLGPPLLPLLAYAEWEATAESNGGDRAHAQYIHSPLAAASYIERLSAIATAVPLA